MKKFRLTEETRLGNIVETHITDIESTSLRGAKTKATNYLVKSVEEKDWYDGQSLDVDRYKNGKWIDKFDGSSERIVHVDKVARLVEITEEDDNTSDTPSGYTEKSTNDKGKIRIQVTYYDKSTTEATGIYLNSEFDYQEAVENKSADLLFIQFDDGKVVFRKDFDGNDLFKNAGIIHVNHGCIVFYDYKDGLTHTEGLDHKQISETYPRGRMINVEGRTYTIIGYGSAMFSGNDTDMALCVVDYINQDKKFFETSEVSPDMLIPQ